MITFHRTGTKSYETKIDGQRWSINELGGTWYVVRDGEIVFETDGFRSARDFVEATVVAEQNAAQDAAADAGMVPCYNMECLAATGPVCVCGCGGAGHGMVYAGTLVKF
jgi:hypothetical protein